MNVNGPFSLALIELKGVMDGEGGGGNLFSAELCTLRKGRTLTAAQGVVWGFWSRHVDDSAI